MLKDLAKMAACICGAKVVFDIPESDEKAGYSTATKARLDGSKLKGLGWGMKYDIYAGIERTIKILREVYH
jgi:nucleoside-diphosphate-sugar epimerase